jgi:hypothetical protein
VFDAGRAVAIAWALFVACRARTPLAATMVAVTAYLYGLEIAAGFTIRDQGPMDPILACLLVAIGPSGMPPGPLGSLPLAAVAVRWPALLHLLAALLLVIPFALLHRRCARLWPESKEARRLGSAALALLIAAVLEAIEAGMLFLPYVMSRDI